ncbi:unnamed protein product, partial [Litomosoides sigmodontis]
PKRQKLDDDADEKLAENANSSNRLTQLKKDIAILEAAVQFGEEMMEKMLHIAIEDMAVDPLVTVSVQSRQEDLLRRRDSLIAELISIQNAAGKKNQMQRLQDGSAVNVSEYSGKKNGTAFVEVKAWQLRKCGCDFCSVYNSSRNELLPPRV